MFFNQKNKTISPDRIYNWDHHQVILDIEEEKIKQKLSMIGINEDTLKIMKEQKSLFESNADRVVEKFYEKVSTIPHLMNIIDHHSTIDRLIKTQKLYFLSLSDGVIDDKYIENRKRIGKVHERIQLDSEWFFGAYQIYYKEVIPLLMDKYQGDPRVSEVILAFTRLTTFDMQLVEETYLETYTSKMLKLDEIKRLEQQLLHSSQTLLANVEETSSSTQNMYASSEEISAAAEEATVHAEHVQEMAEHGGEVVNKTLLQIRDIEEQMIKLKDSTGRINDSSKKIGEIILVIQGIAKQTNILALNASIEAARAGEHGKGFAVVAEEVKSLAQSTQSALEDIRVLISRSHDAVKDMLSVVQQTDDSVTQGGKYTEQLKQELETMIQGISNNLEQVTTVTNQVKHFSEMSEQVSNSSQEIAKLAEELHFFGEELSAKLN